MTFKERYIKTRSDFKKFIQTYPLTVDDLHGEVWAPIKDCESYQVSNYGRVKSFKKGTTHILKPFLDRNGYLTCTLRVNRKQKPINVHRLVAKAFIPNPDNKPQVNHIDGCKWNSCFSNLEWATREENMCHADITGLRMMPQGEDNSQAKLTTEQVVLIRENPDNLSCKQLAELFAVSDSTIGEIQRGLRYRNAGGHYRSKFETKLTKSTWKEIYCLYQTKGLTQKQIGEIFNVSAERVGQIIRRIDKENKQKTNYRLRYRLPDETRTKIRTEYKKGVRGSGSPALARKYGVSQKTILNIVNEQ